MYRIVIVNNLLICKQHLINKEINNTLIISSKGITKTVFPPNNVVELK